MIHRVASPRRAHHSIAAEAPPPEPRRAVNRNARPARVLRASQVLPCSPLPAPARPTITARDRSTHHINSHRSTDRTNTCHRHKVDDRPENATATTTPPTRVGRSTINDYEPPPRFSIAAGIISRPRQQKIEQDPTGKICRSKSLITRRRRRCHVADASLHHAQARIYSTAIRYIIIRSRHATHRVCPPPPQSRPAQRAPAGAPAYRDPAPGQNTMIDD